jgi:hypothetical protein
MANNVRRYKNLFKEINLNLNYELRIGIFQGYNYIKL